MLAFRLTGAVAVFCIASRLSSPFTLHPSPFISHSSYFLYLSHYVFFLSFIDNWMLSLPHAFTLHPSPFTILPSPFTKRKPASRNSEGPAFLSVSVRSAYFSTTFAPLTT
jgi:hypothetical protein